MLLATSLFELHVQGGVDHMAPLSITFVVNIAVMIYCVSMVIRKKQINPFWLEAIKQIGGLAAALGAYGTLVGLFQAFNSLEGSKEVIPFPVISGGMKVALITVLYGLIIYCVSLVAYIVLRFVTRKQAQA